MAEGQTKVSFDVDRVWGLLEVADLTRELPTLKPIQDEALRELHGVALDILEKQRKEREDLEAQPKEKRYGT
jgi:hypothetical protein